MFNTRVAFVVAVAVAGACSNAAADFVVFSDKAAFLASTQAVDASGDLPATGFIGQIGGSPPGPTTTVGTVTFQAVRYLFTDWSARLAGNELAISFGAEGFAKEDLNIIAAGPVFSLGFDFVEPERDPLVNAPFVDSTFTVTVKNGAVALFSFTFNAPNDTAAFVGVWGDQAFDRVEIRETIGDDENEFFGRVYTGPVSISVPEPGSIALLSAGLLALAGGWRRARRPAGSGRGASQPA